MEPRGTEVRGEAISAGNETKASTLYLQGADSKGRTLDSKEFLHITDLAVFSAAGGLIKIVSATAAGGKYIFYGTLAVTGGGIWNFTQPIQCAQGLGISVVLPNGVDAAVLFNGFITKG